MPLLEELQNESKSKVFSNELGVLHWSEEAEIYYVIAGTDPIRRKVLADGALFSCFILGAWNKTDISSLAVSKTRNAYRKSQYDDLFWRWFSSDKSARRNFSDLFWVLGALGTHHFYILRALEG